MHRSAPESKDLSSYPDQNATRPSLRNHGLEASYSISCPFLFQLSVLHGSKKKSNKNWVSMDPSTYIMMIDICKNLLKSMRDTEAAGKCWVPNMEPSWIDFCITPSWNSRQPSMRAVAAYEHAVWPSRHALAECRPLGKGGIFVERGQKVQLKSRRVRRQMWGRPWSASLIQGNSQFLEGNQIIQQLSAPRN